MMMLHRLARAAPWLVPMLLAATATAAETLTFTAPGYPGLPEFFRGQARGEVSLQGRLLLPEPLNAPVPAVIIAHASGGVTADVPDIARRANRAGYAAFYYDSYAAHGIQNVAQGGAQTAVAHQAGDAWAAAQALGADPRIDARRLALIGMSAGGGAALVTATAHLQRPALGAGRPRLAAHVAFYPGVHMAPAPSAMTGAPVLIVQGEADDYQKPARVQAWTAHVKREQPDAPVTLLMLPGGPHSFLTPGLEHRWVGAYANASQCPVLLVQRGRPRYLALDGTVGDSRACEPTRGGAMGHDAQAAERGLDAAMAFLKQAFAAVP